MEGSIRLEATTEALKAAVNLELEIGPNVVDPFRILRDNAYE